MAVNYNLMTNKTKFYTVFITKVLKRFVYGLKVNQNQINIYILATKILYALTFLKNNSITNFDKLVDIVVVDNIANQNRFEISYVF
jgi:NADH:ubiquinone oxidoreductase subunit C